ncbi:response regulator [Flavobacterium sp. SUN046]|uniref:response regulator n=1 Tax=Flavobacterium sp. SUN046 TaxID=3002440 RepID=UPI002DBB454A|nr:response regulator [Flavobacterium sp. SUN046]MEC4050467.1 response regulator [Flavobacterium sp. SUN046]
MKQINLIYVIEDDPITQYLMQQLFSFYPEVQSVLYFNNGALALESLKENTTPDLIFLDLNMPIMDGWEFLDAIQPSKTFSSIPIYIMTSSINNNDEVRATNYPSVKGYHTKPFNEEVIQLIIQK